MKTIEVNLSEAHHQLLLEHASRDRTNKSLASVAGMLLVDALSREVAKHTVGRREAAVAALVAADRRKAR